MTDAEKTNTPIVVTDSLTGLVLAGSRPALEELVAENATGLIVANADVDVNPGPHEQTLPRPADRLTLSAMDYVRAHGIYRPRRIGVPGFDGVPGAISRGLWTPS